MPHLKTRHFPLLTIDSKLRNSPPSRSTSGVHIPLLPINVAVAMNDLFILLWPYPLLQFSFFLSFDFTSIFQYINSRALFSFLSLLFWLCCHFKYISISHAIAWSDMIFFIAVPCILISSKSFIHQQMHYLLILENSKIYIKTYIKISPTRFGPRPSSGSLHSCLAKVGVAGGVAA
jgi:hypothetical protein